MNKYQRERLNVLQQDLEVVLADLDESLIDAQVHYGHMTDVAKNSIKGKKAKSRVESLDHAHYFVKLATGAIKKVLENK